MRRDIVWLPWDTPGMEHLILRPAEHAGVEAESTIVGMSAGGPYTVQYRIACDTAWRARRIVVEASQGLARVDLRSDGQGVWTHPDGEVVRSLAGCLDVDISATPFTNTLPIRRLQLASGESRDIDVVYVSVPSLQYSVLTQRYTCLERDTRYRYESLVEGMSVFSADLRVDGDGLVLDYPGLFRRVNVGQDLNR